jgi:2-dehydropantoate 2-reductase
MKKTFAVLGAGSIGCYLGACLVSAGYSTILVGRERIKNQITEHGLRVTDWKGRDDLLNIEQLQYSTSIDAIAKADYILLTVKSGDTESTAKLIGQYALPSATIVSFQNGTQNAATLHAILPEHKIIKGMVPFNVLNNGKGQFHCGTEGDLAIEANKEEVSELVSAFEKANLPISLHADINGVQWGKLIMNLNNAVNALSGVPLLDQLNNRSYRLIMKKVIAEALSVLSVAGIKPAKTGKVVPSLMPYILGLPNFLFKRVASATLKIDPKARSSMYDDFVLKRKTEIDYLNGEIVSLAKQHGMQAPVNQSIVQLVKLAEEKQQGSPKHSPEFLQKAIQNGL